MYHTPPYKTLLWRAAQDGIKIDHVPLDFQVGSIADSRFNEKFKPRATLHDHIHESARITGGLKEKIAESWCLSDANEGNELAVVEFMPERPEKAERILY